MADWDEDSPQLGANLREALRSARDGARRRELLSAESARRWHATTMDGLELPDPRYAATFRGEPGLERCEVRVGRHLGVPAAEVAAALAAFESTLQVAVARLDALLPPGALPTGDALDAILDVMAWTHAEWVRIHPFANGNGRTARIWANAIAMRYGLPPFVRLRPRPDDGYGAAGAHAMTGDWEPTALVFRRLLDRFLDESR